MQTNSATLAFVRPKIHFLDIYVIITLLCLKEILSRRMNCFVDCSNPVTCKENAHPIVKPITVHTLFFFA